MPFCKRSLDFLAENYIMNNREWFSAHKDEYIRCVKEPFLDFIAALEPVCHETDGDIAFIPKISRIYRDLRFTKDKTIFRNSVWFSFGRPSDSAGEFPSFYFEISPSGYGCGCGFYSAGASVMEYMRKMILDESSYFLSAMKAYQSQNIFTLSGDDYKRSRSRELPDEYRVWYDKKSVYLSYTDPCADNLFNNALADRISEYFRLIIPVYRFFLEAAEGSRRGQSLWKAGDYFNNY